MDTPNEITEQQGKAQLFHALLRGNEADLVPGLKRNEHKPMITLVPPEFVEELAKVFEYGLKKYERNSWKNFTPEQAISCLPDAAMRHIYAWMKGEEYDAESGLPHLMSAAWNILVTDFHTRGKTGV